ncbi:MAG: alpha/beta hydrolase-fold protein [Defluviitaleaceae bacterium]|nr:alpha/beta hydrolase-fold protein [Defluviitaleaceae bacterium]
MAFLQANCYSESLCRQVAFNAVVPVGKKRVKTLYLLHGQKGNYMDWIVNSRIASYAEARGLAVIMPSADNSFHVDNENACALYGDFFGRELVEITRGLFQLSDKCEDTFIAGFSMGGYGAIRTGLKYNETFGAIAGLSSAFLIVDRAVNFTSDTPSIRGRRSYFESVFGDLAEIPGSDNDPKFLINELKQKGAKIPNIYLCCGTEDILIAPNRCYHNFLKENDVPHTYVESAGAHNWEFWNEYILKVLDWLPL